MIENTPLAGDVDYAPCGSHYAALRRPDPRIEARIHAALGAARTILNIGAGAGSYEPLDRHVIAIEPSPAMRAQRPPHLAPALRGRAESLPLDDASVDASMAIATVHQWQDLSAGLRELRRVTRGPIVLLCFEGDALDRYWLAEYVPELIAVERRRYPAIARLQTELSLDGRRTELTAIPIPIDCTDGFTEAFYARPEKFLDPAVTQAQSAWTFVAPAVRERFLAALHNDLRSGGWDARFGTHRTLPAFEGSLRLIVSTPTESPSKR
ncbi:MAG: class I SAM-dependent methyltransferase [Phycisphaerae bacterium]|nr:class I SAM-dependent methyltransferase [Phycisphaerae bacterium]